jgi:phosphohistidine phosphatase
MSVLIYLVRHAIAEVAAGGKSDADRRLTSEGRRRMRGVAAGLRRLGIVPEVLLSSPLRRAEETAAVIVDVLGPELTVEILPALAPGCAPDEVLAALHRHRAAGQLMLVGHQPDLGCLASHLLTARADLVPLPFKKGGVAAIELSSLPPRSPGILHWFLTPKQLRLVAD